MMLSFAFRQLFKFMRPTLRIVVWVVIALIPGESAGPFPIGELFFTAVQAAVIAMTAYIHATTFRRLPKSLRSSKLFCDAFSSAWIVATVLLWNACT